MFNTDNITKNKQVTSCKLYSHVLKFNILIKLFHLINDNLKKNNEKISQI